MKVLGLSLLGKVVKLYDWNLYLTEITRSMFFVISRYYWEMLSLNQPLRDRRNAISKSQCESTHDNGAVYMDRKK